MELRLDLHIHSERSFDGCMSLSEIVALARERGLNLVWVAHDLCDPRVYTRQAIRDQFNVYMRTVMREEPLDPSIEVLPDENAW